MKAEAVMKADLINITNLAVLLLLIWLYTEQLLLLGIKYNAKGHSRFSINL